MSLELKKKVRKQVLVLANSKLVAVTKVEAAKTTKAGKNGEGDKYLGTNLAQVLCI